MRTFSRVLFYSTLVGLGLCVLASIPIAGAAVGTTMLRVIATLGVALPILVILAMFVVVCSYRDRFTFSVPIGPSEDGILLILIPMVTYGTFSQRLSTMGFDWFQHWGGNLYFPFLAVVTMFLLRYWRKSDLRDGEVLEEKPTKTGRMSSRQ